jgi:methionyl-tRNA formyltransferase
MVDPVARREASLCIVVLTQRSPRGEAIVGALAYRGLGIAAVVVDSGRTVSRDRARQTIRMLERRGLARTARRAVSRVHRALARRRHGDELRRLRQYTNRVTTVSDANGQECENLLQSLAPDVLVLGSSRILRSNILEIPRLGTLNPHPGLLPEYRGLDVIPWAIYNGDPLGVTVHVVDPGIDTGDIVAQQTFDLQPGDTLRSLRQRADAILGRLMAEVVSEVVASGRLEGRRQETGRGHLYSRMPPPQKQQVEAMLRTMAVRSV